MDFVAFSRYPIFFIVSARCGLDKDLKSFDRCFIDLEDPIFFPSNAPKIDDTAFEDATMSSLDISENHFIEDINEDIAELIRFMAMEPVNIFL